MKRSHWARFIIATVLSLMVAEAAGKGSPVVKPSCTISWDESEEQPQIAEYRITVWRVDGHRPSKKTTHIVKAPRTQVSCQEVGAGKVGRWQATVQACLADGTCSEASQPLSFRVAEK